MLSKFFYQVKIGRIAPLYVFNRLQPYYAVKLFYKQDLDDLGEYVALLKSYEIK